MKNLTRLALIAAFAAAPMAACTEREAENAADRTGEAAENVGSDVASATDNAADATGDAARDVTAETRETVDNTVDREETTVRAGEDGLEVRNTETR